MGGHVPWSLTAGHSEGVRGIERGIKLAVMPLANSTGELARKSSATTTFSSPAPASGVIVWSLVETLPEEKATKASFLLVMRNAESRGWLVWNEWQLVEIGIWSCYTCRMVRGMTFAREQPWFNSCVCKSDGSSSECFTCDDIMRRFSQFASLMFSVATALWKHMVEIIRV